MSVVLAERRRFSGPAHAPKFGAKLAAAVMLVFVADLLFYERHVGISLPIFLLLVAGGLLATGCPKFRSKSAWLSVLMLIAGLFPLVDNVSPLSVVIALVALAAFALAATNRLRRGLAKKARQIGGFLIAAPFRILPDLARWRLARSRIGPGTEPGRLAVWMLPLGLGAVFVVLFGIANPVIERWLDMIELWRLLNLLSAPRVAFWLLVLAGVWGFLRPRILWFQRPRPIIDLIGPVKPRRVDVPRPLAEAIWGEAAILRSLIVFNALFAVETVLDIAYLWGGIALPDGMTYAAYAHRGAYPLIVTALLAAAFVLGAAREGSKAVGNRRIRILIYVWTGQNVMLVVSSILRLDLYVEVYSLSYWRIAAFIWMGLVAAGLVLIIARIALGKPNDWLLAANLLTLSATLYACSFVNFAALIANWNVDHRPQPGETARFLDTSYLLGLGPQALPAIDRLLEAPDGRAANWAQWMKEARDELAGRHEIRMQDWRAWTFRDWRLMRYVHQHAAMIAPEGRDGSLGR